MAVKQRWPAYRGWWCIRIVLEDGLWAGVTCQIMWLFAQAPSYGRLSLIRTSLITKLASRLVSMTQNPNILYCISDMSNQLVTSSPGALHSKQCLCFRCWRDYWTSGSCWRTLTTECCASWELLVVAVQKPMQPTSKSCPPPGGIRVKSLWCLEDSTIRLKCQLRGMLITVSGHLWEGE